MAHVDRGPLAVELGLRVAFQREPEPGREGGAGALAVSDGGAATVVLERPLARGLTEARPRDGPLGKEEIGVMLVRLEEDGRLDHRGARLERRARALGIEVAVERGAGADGAQQRERGHFVGAGLRRAARREEEERGGLAVGSTRERERRVGARGVPKEGVVREVWPATAVLFPRAS